MLCALGGCEKVQFVFYYFGGREERENFNKVLMAVGLFSDSKAEQLCQSVRRYTQV